ncbi:DUF6928 family protein [Streptomyces sp. NPDC090054]|uniref:DUF6928 family protein n=1 Tax=Streptomyces sp. NPDC090054 TaxID=3365933 RepID=UPI003804C38A
MEAAESEILGDGIYPPMAARFPGADVVCDRRLVIGSPSKLPERLVAAGAGRRMVLHAVHSALGWPAFAVWEDGRLVRSLSLSSDSGVAEDSGEPFPFEAPYWAGDRSVRPYPGLGGKAPYPLPFPPLELGEEALRAFFGFILEGRPAPDDIDPDELRLHGFRLKGPAGPDLAQRHAELEAAAQRMHGTTHRLGPDGTLTEVSVR